jgi:hypothetical protein
MGDLAFLERRFSKLLCLPERLDGVPWGLPERLDGVPWGLPERLDGVPCCLDTVSPMAPPGSLRPPASDEFAPFYAGYVARVAAVSDPIEELIAQRGGFLHQLARLSQEQAHFRYAAGKWSIKEIVGHLADAERILSYRMLRISRGDSTPLAGWDENDYAQTAGFDSRPLQDLAGDWAAARDATIALTRGLPDGAWEQRGVANNSPVTARALLYIILGHVEHHRAVMQERYGA